MVAQEVDIAARFSLRSATRHYKTMHRALWLAIIVHIIAWIFWQPFHRVTAPELPDWINIRLVAGFEEQAEPQVKPENKPALKPAKQKLVTPAPAPAEQAQVDSEAEPATKESVDDSEPASASTFVQADSRAFALKNSKPAYPSTARRRGMQGVVLLQVNVSNTGIVTGIHIMRSSGFRVLDISAVNSVRKWRFMPARQGETKVASTVQIPIRFSLDG